MIGRPSARSLRTRQALFFVAAILLPCVFLILLTVRMLVQDRELTDKRVADEGRRVADDTRQMLLARVERLRAATTPRPAEVVVVATVERGRVVFPWEDAARKAAAVLRRPSFGDRIARGERLEFGASGRARAAAAAYQRARAEATDTTQRAYADLLAMRAMTRAGRTAQARALGSQLAALPANIVDDQGVPLVLYAARSLADVATSEQLPLISAAIDAAIATSVAGPEAMRMAADIAAKREETTPTGARAAARAHDLEQALELREAMLTLGVTATDLSDPIWVTVGPSDRTWLVSAATQPDGMVHLTVVDAEPILSAAPATAVVTVSGDGEFLAPNFPSLRAGLAPGRVAALTAEGAQQRPFYLSALAVVVGVALAGAYLFWRDMRRDIRAAELRSQFVSSVSHELKTPLTAIRMFAETLLLRDSTPAAVRQEYLETIVNESERLSRLLDNVLDFSKIESGKQSYRAAPVSLAEVVRAAAKAMQYPLAQQRFDLRVTIDDHLPPVAIDADAIQQAVLNLLSNAMKYSGDGRVIELTLTREGDEAVIAVSDHGVGIPVHEHHRIFEKFYRVRSDATERVAGTGLGLTLVDHVTRGHGGRVDVVSAPGSGSTFAIRLPLGVTL